MFQPKYTLTTKLLRNTTKIERLYGQLEGLQVPKKLMLNLERENLITSTYASNKIEGNPLSRIEVTNLLLGERVPVNRAEKEVINYFQILNSFSKNSNGDLTILLMLELHKLLMTGVNDDIKGTIRNQKVVVGSYDEKLNLVIKHNPPFHTEPEITRTLKDLFDWVNNEEDVLNILKIGIFHHQFEYIHPFEDGNGRIGRLLTVLLFLKYNYAINRYFILDDYYDIDKNEYSDSLHTADSGDNTKWLEYFTQGIIYSMQSALGKLNLGLSKLSVSIRPTPKEKEALEIIQRYNEVTTQNIAAEMKVSRQQAFNLLKSLIEKGFIEQIGESKSTYYVLL